MHEFVLHDAKVNREGSEDGPPVAEEPGWTSCIGFWQFGQIKEDCREFPAIRIWLIGFIGLAKLPLHRGLTCYCTLAMTRAGAI